MTQNLTIYRSSSKLSVIKAPKHSAGAFGQQNRFSKVYQKMIFVLQMEKLLGNLEIWWQLDKGELMIYNFVIRKCLQNLTGNGWKMYFFEFFAKEITFSEVFQFFSNEDCKILTDK